jgi:hypothetical protein
MGIRPFASPAAQMVIRNHNARIEHMLEAKREAKRQVKLGILRAQRGERREQGRALLLKRQQENQWPLFGTLVVLAVWVAVDNLVSKIKKMPVPTEMEMQPLAAKLVRFSVCCFFNVLTKYF